MLSTIKWQALCFNSNKPLETSALFKPLVSHAWSPFHKLASDCESFSVETMRENQQLSSQTWCNTKLISPLMKLTHFACSWWVCIHQWCTEARTYILMNPDTEESTRSFNVVYTCTLSSFWPADSCFAFLPTFSLFLFWVLYWWPSSAQLPVCWLWPYSEPKWKKRFTLTVEHIHAVWWMFVLSLWWS